MAAFADATAVTADGPDRWRAQIVDGWDVGGNANGGYLLAIAGRALGLALDRPDPVSVSAHYLAPGQPGPLEVRTATIRSGRRFATGRVDLVAADGRTILTGLGSFADLAAAGGGPEQVDGAPPDLPPPDDCQPASPSLSIAPSIMGRVDVRLHPDDAGFAQGEPSGTARIRGWFRLRDGEPLDTTALLLAVDAFPPTVFNARLPVAWVPTLELTAHIRRRPAPGWLRAAFTTRFITGGFLDEDAEVWDATDRLVAQSRQLALLPRG